MNVRKIGQAALVVLAAGSLASAAPGTALAAGPGASVTGGESGLETAQQNTAQAHRQNNNCNNPNVDSELIGSRRTDECATADISRNNHSVVRKGRAEVEGGDGQGRLTQHNTAQQGRQNNNCGNSNSTLDLTDSEVTHRCTDLDGSLNNRTFTKGGGAHTTGGDSAAAFNQHNAAQEGRQNNNCNNSDITTVQSSQLEGDCANLDRSLNNRTRVGGGGAETTSTDGDLLNVHRNAAQEGRQNNNCNNPDLLADTSTDSQTAGDCVNLDRSLNNRTLTKGKGAKATGGQGESVGTLFEQNTAQEGRQNNNCGNINDSVVDLSDTQAENRCAHLDRSLNNRTVKKGGGAEAVGGSTPAALSEQNTAQEGRQNNNCGNGNGSFITSTDSQIENRCATVDRSLNNRTVDKSNGARVVGGDSLATLKQQNTAQDGQQNNNCGNPNDQTLTLTDSQVSGGCFAYNGSRNNDSSFE